VGVGSARVRAFGPASQPLEEGTLVQLEFPAEAIRAWPAARPAGK
jgi:iron(III) transport system ATP-binding protein